MSDSLRSSVQADLELDRQRATSLPGDERRWDVADVMEVLDRYNVWDQAPAFAGQVVVPLTRYDAVSTSLLLLLKAVEVVVSGDSAAVGTERALLGLIANHIRKLAAAGDPYGQWCEGRPSG